MTFWKVIQECQLLAKLRKRKIKIKNIDSREDMWITHEIQRTLMIYFKTYLQISWKIWKNECYSMLWSTKIGKENMDHLRSSTVRMRLNSNKVSSNWINPGTNVSTSEFLLDEHNNLNPFQKAYLTTYQNILLPYIWLIHKAISRIHYTDVLGTEMAQSSEIERSPLGKCNHPSRS